MTSSQSKTHINEILKISDTEELLSKVWDFVNEDWEALPLEGPCDRGGIPDPESLNVGTINLVSRDAERIVLRFMVYFDEIVCTSCDRVVLDFPKSIDCQMTIDVEMEDREYEADSHRSYEDEEPEPEF